MSTAPFPTISRRVAVIGAGAAGLVAGRELRREGHAVVIYERGNQIGGIWVYTPEIEPGPIGLDPARSIIHSSLYSSLRTNLPREIMGFRDYPFVTRPGENRDPRRYPGHQEVLMYLKDFAAEFGIEEMIRFETEVVKLGIVENGKWKVRSKRNSDFDEEIYDAVVICNGHYTEPRIALIPGIDVWPGKQLHSHNYRVPEPFRDQVVVLIGYSASGVDICRDIAEAAKEVHVASRSVPDETYAKQPGYNNIWLHSTIESVHEDGRVVFRNGKSTVADFIMHCTGYTYHFPFLETTDAVIVDDNRVEPLYKHVFPPALAPWISFIGLPLKTLVFFTCELQSKWVAGVLSGRITLPSEKEMMEDVESFYSTLEASRVPKRYTHLLVDSQFEYGNWLGGQCGCGGYEKWRELMFRVAIKFPRPETYRDEWEDRDLVAQAHEDFSEYTFSIYS